MVGFSFLIRVAILVFLFPVTPSLQVHIRQGYLGSYLLSPLQEMALGTLPPSSESWARWPAGADFGAIDAGMVPYQGRPGTLDPLQRRGQSEHFLPCAFTPAPLPSPPPGTQYHPPVTYAGYASHSLPAAMDTPLRPPLASHGLTLETDAGRGGGQETWHGFPSAERSQSPSIKSETQMSAAASTSSLSPKLPKTIIPNVRVFGAPEHKADTAVDNLLKILQTKYGFRELSEETDTDRESEESEECDGVVRSALQPPRNDAVRSG